MKSVAANLVAGRSQQEPPVVSTMRVWALLVYTGQWLEGSSSKPRIGNNARKKNHTGLFNYSTNHLLFQIHHTTSSFHTLLTAKSSTGKDPWKLSVHPGRMGGSRTNERNYTFFHYNNQENRPSLLENFLFNHHSND